MNGVQMEYDTILLTDKGFKYMSDLTPNKDYLVTKSGKLARFLGFGEPINLNHLVKFNTGETFKTSGDTIIDVNNDTCLNCLDVDMMCGIENTTIKQTHFIDIKSRRKPGFNRNDCYNIGFRRDLDKLINVNFTVLSINQRKEIMAGLIDNGETIIENNQIIIPHLQSDFRNIIIFIARSLGFDAITNQNNDVFIKTNTKCGLLPIKSIVKQKDVLILSNMDVYDNKIKVISISDYPIEAGVILNVDTNEPILIGYSLIPVIQKGET